MYINVCECHFTNQRVNSVIDTEPHAPWSPPIQLTTLTFTVS